MNRGTPEYEADSAKAYFALVALYVGERELISLTDVNDDELMRVQVMRQICGAGCRLLEGTVGFYILLKPLVFSDKASSWHWFHSSRYGKKSSWSFELIHNESGEARHCFRFFYGAVRKKREHWGMVRNEFWGTFRKVIQLGSAQLTALESCQTLMDLNLDESVSPTLIYHSVSSADKRKAASALLSLTPSCSLFFLQALSFLTCWCFMTCKKKKKKANCALND